LCRIIGFHALSNLVSSPLISIYHPAAYQGVAAAGPSSSSRWEWQKNTALLVLENRNQQLQDLLTQVHLLPTPEEAVEVDTWVGMVVGMLSAAAASSWLLLWALLIFCRQREMLWSMKLAHTKIAEYWEKLCNAARKRHCF
jgi:hypothetical protein